VSVPVAAGATLGVNGGAVTSSDGSIVMVPPGALAEDTAISLTSLSSNDLSLPLPDGLQFAGGFKLDLGENSLKMPAQLAIPAPPAYLPVPKFYSCEKVRCRMLTIFKTLLG
jgi:hypothetical protein